MHIDVYLARTTLRVVVLLHSTLVRVVVSILRARIRHDITLIILEYYNITNNNIYYAIHYVYTVRIVCRLSSTFIQLLLL